MAGEIISIISGLMAIVGIPGIIEIRSQLGKGEKTWKSGLEFDKVPLYRGMVSKLLWSPSFLL